jgi:hypothetical protein
MILATCHSCEQEDRAHTISFGQTAIFVSIQLSKPAPNSKLQASSLLQLRRLTSLTSHWIVWQHIYQSSHLSSFFPTAGPDMLPFLTALVPMPDGLPRCPALPAAAALARASPAEENSSQKSCLSVAGPLGGAPKASQKSFFSGSARRVLVDPSPSTKRLKAVPALAADDCNVWPRVPAVLRACEAMSASASLVGGQ